MRTINSHVKSPLASLLMTSWEEWPTLESVLEPFRSTLTVLVIYSLVITVHPDPEHSQDLSIVPEPPCSPVSPLASFFCPLQGSPILCTWGRDTAQGSRGWLAVAFVSETSSTIMGIAESKSGSSCILIESITKSSLGDHVLLMMFCDVPCTACCNRFPLESDIKH